MAGTKSSPSVGAIVAPWRFIVFAVLAGAAGLVLVPILGLQFGIMASFDSAAIAFLLSCIPLLYEETGRVRSGARRNDANRVALLALSAAVSIVIVIVVANALLDSGAPKPLHAALIVGTLLLCWLFSNTVYTLHYAHMFYRGDEEGKDQGGLSFPHTKEPDYSDFFYFAFCLGMTFQTSDAQINSRAIRHVVTCHALAAFFFNIGVIAFIINILGN